MYSLTKTFLGKAAVTSLVGIVAAFSFVVGTASAHQDPGGCTETGVGISLAVFRADEVTSIGSGTVSPGETIKYRVTLSALGSPSCNYEAGTLSITTPDGTTDVTPGGGIPLVSPGNPFVSAFVPYVVDTAEMGGDGDIDASANYTGGQSHTGTVHDTATGSVTKQNAVTGKIITIKQTTPDGSQQLFDFNVSWDAGEAPDFQLADNSQNDSGPLAPAGTYDVSEVNLPSGWTLTSTNCVSSFGDPADTDGQDLDLDAGETITCTFTNTQGGRIIVNKVTDPAGDPQSFNFTTTGAGYSNFALTDAADPNNQAVAPGTYSVAETPVAGWDLTSATCDQGETIESIDVGPGETVTCTFNNQKDSTIIVEKQTVPNGSSQVFDFDLSYGDNDADLSDGQQDNSGDLAPGVYTVSENLPAGWDLTSAICSDQSPANAISLQAGETVTCVFTNTQQQGRIIVNKITLPAGDPQSFNFDATGTGYNDFSLTDAADPNNQAVAPGTYSVSETLPAGWIQTSAVCDMGETIDSIDVGAGETVTCTFTNTKKGHIIVDKVTVPGGSSQSFDFTATGAGYSNFSLTDAASPNNQEVVPGAYTVSEGAVAGWDQTSATCDNGEEINSIDVGPGETITCTFTNTQQAGRIIVIKQTDPNGDSQMFDFDASWDAGGSPDFQLSDGQSNDSGPLAAGKYTVAEVNLPANWALSTATCDNGETIGDIDVGPGETVTCTFTNTYTPPATQGCSPGYWKQSQHFGSYPEGIYPNTLFKDVFGSNVFGNKTLLQVLSQGGGGINALGRIMVGAFLNASTVEDFAYTPAEVIAAFNGATPATYGSVKATFEALQDPCPFGNNPGPAGPEQQVSAPAKVKGPKKEEPVVETTAPVTTTETSDAQVQPETVTESSTATTEPTTTTTEEGSTEVKTEEPVVETTTQ